MNLTDLSVDVVMMTATVDIDTGIIIVIEAFPCIIKCFILYLHNTWLLTVQIE